MSPCLSRVLCIALAVAGSGVPLLGQPFHSSYFMGDPGNEIASAVRVDDSGFVGVGHFEGAGTVFKLRSNGAVDWVRSYGPVRPVAVRSARAGGIAWIGNVPHAERPVPIFVLSDSTVGALRRTIRFNIGNMQRAEVTALEVDPDDGTFWVGGNAWFTAERQELWLAHLDAAGMLLSISAFRPEDIGNQSVRIESLVPTAAPGVLAVGRWSRDPLPFTFNRHHMFALRLDDKGKLLWSRAYSERVTLLASEQWLVDVARDPRSPGPGVHAVGRADKICGIDRPTALPCVDLFTGAVLIEIDETTGDLKDSMFLAAGKHTAIFTPTAIASDQLNNVVAVGGSLDTGVSGSREAVLVRARTGDGRAVLGTRSYGDGSGPFVSEVADLSLIRVPSSPVVEPGFVLAGRQSKPGVDRPTVITTDIDGRSDGSCERAVDIFQNPSIVVHVDIPLMPTPAATEGYTLSPNVETLGRLSCLRLVAAAEEEEKKSAGGHR